MPNVQRVSVFTEGADLVDKLLHRVLCACASVQSYHRFSDFLNRWTNEVHYVSDGRSCVDFALDAHEKENPFDLIIVDINLPGIDGCSTASLLRENEYPHPIISICHTDMPSYEFESEDSGCNSHVSGIDPTEKLLPLFEQYQRGRFEMSDCPVFAAKW